MSGLSAGIERWSGRLLRTGVLHHVFGIGGQVAAAAPLIVVAIILSHTVGLVTAGHFVIAAGASAIIFTTAFLGLVYYVSVDRLYRFDARDYVITRVIATTIAIALLFAVSGHLGIPLPLVLLVALLRTGDAAVDLAWGLDLLRRQTDLAMRRYTFLNVGKLAIVLLPVSLWLVTDAVATVPLLIFGAGVAAVLCWIWLIRLSWGTRTTAPVGGQFARSMSLARHAVWFTIGASASAAVNSAPRLVIDRLYVGDSIGIVGVTLAFSTIFAMAFMSTWLRWFPRLSKAPDGQRRFSRMVLESSAMGLLFLLLNMTVMPWVVALLFGFNIETGGDLCRKVLIASIFFAFSMNLANLFKVTRAVWLESATYVAGIAAGLGYVMIFPAAGVPGFLIAGSVAMLAMVVTGMTWVKQASPSITGVPNKRAIFLRLAGRPVPRVTRMMTVAKDAGFDVLFVGAFRDKSLPEQDSWEGFAVRRVGKPFPLLNGKRPLLYISAVLSCNLGFLSVLWKERPGVVHASDLEAMPAAILYRITHSSRLIFNIHDNLAQRYALPAWINACLNAVEGVSVLLSDQALVPEAFRRMALPAWCRHKVHVIRNLPPDNGATPAPPFENGKIRLFYGGWLDWQRGLGALLALAKEPDIELRIAGEGAPEIVDELKRLSSVTYLGFLDSGAVIEETMRCHFVPVLYDPSRVINRFAASNKLAEALSIGRPMILNEELEIAKEYAGASCIIDTSYARVATIAPKLRTLALDPSAYAEACRTARQLYDLNYDWAKVRADSLDALTGTRCDRPAVCL
jgi:glycosyltransferase involved in cell wall biosynthesis